MSKQDVIQMEASHIAKTFNRFDVVFEKGDGSMLWDNEGKQYIDFFSGHAVMNLGYNHPKQIKAMQMQLANLVHTGNLYYLEPQARLAKYITDNTFGDKVLFSNSGAEIVELAIKLARKWAAKEQPGVERYEMLTVRGSFHGRTYGALTATGQDKMHQGIMPVLPGFKYVNRNDFTSVAAAITNKTCAVMLEPIQGEGGIHPAEKEYLHKLRDLCDRNHLMLIFDEIQCGLGRTGRMNAYDYYGITPDVLLMAKPLGGGLPISALVTTNAIASALSVGDHGSTFGGNPVAAAAGCVLLEELSQPGFLESIREKGSYLESELKKLAESFPEVITNVRGVGLMWGIEVKEGGPDFVVKALDKGLVINCTAGNVLRCLPALTITEKEMDSAIKILRKLFESV